MLQLRVNIEALMLKLKTELIKDWPMKRKQN